MSPVPINGQVDNVSHDIVSGVDPKVKAYLI